MQEVKKWGGALAKFISALLICAVLVSQPEIGWFLWIVAALGLILFIDSLGHIMAICFGWNVRIIREKTEDLVGKVIFGIIIVGIIFGGISGLHAAYRDAPPPRGGQS